MAPEVVKWNETADSAGCRNRPKQTEWQAREGMLSSTKQLRAQRADTRTPIRAVRSVALDASQISKLGTILATRASTFEPCRGGLVHSKNARALEYRKPNAHNSKSSKRTSESTSFPIYDQKTPTNIDPFGPWIDPPFRSAANEFRIPIAPTLECMYCLYLLFWCVPDFVVHTRGFLALVFRHSPNGENLAAIRVGQQALQGSHLAPSACLRRLHDTHLEPANVAVDGLPVKAVPFRRIAGDRTNRLRCRHLPCLLCRFAQFSRVKHLKEVSSFSRPVMLSVRMTQPVSAPLRNGIRFLLPLMSAPPSAHLAMCFPL